MGFPKETWEWADQKAKQIRKKYACRKYARACGLYEELALPYGFLDNIKSDNWAPWPHEIKTVNCQTSASAVYVVAKQLGLNPAIKAASGVRNDKSEPHGMYHFFIEVDVGAKKPLIVDPSRKMFGYIRYDNDTCKLALDNKFTGLQKFEYSSTWTLTEDEYATKLEHQRTRKLSVLAEGQCLATVYSDRWKSKLGWDGYWYVRYNPEESTVETRVCFGRHSYLHYRILETKAYVHGAKIAKRELNFLSAKSYNWWALQDPKHLATMDFEAVNQIGPTARTLKRAEHTTLEQLVQAQIKGETVPEASQNVVETARAVIQLAQPAYQTFRMQATDAELRRILAEASYQRARGGKHTVFTHQEMLDYCRKAFDKYTKEGIQNFLLANNHNLHVSRIQRIPRAIAASRRSGRRADAAFNKVNTICKLHANDAEHRFSAILDRHLYAKKIKRRKLKPGDFTEPELLSAYATMLTEYVIIAAHARKQLRLEGIENKIVKAIREAELQQSSETPTRQRECLEIST